MEFFHEKHLLILILFAVYCLCTGQSDPNDSQLQDAHLKDQIRRNKHLKVGSQSLSNDGRNQPLLNNGNIQGQALDSNADPLPVLPQKPLQNGAYQKQMLKSKSTMKKKISKPASIAESEECAEDVERICKGRRLKNNFEILTCLVDERQDSDDLSEECHQYIWSYKFNVTTNPQFSLIAREVCKKDLTKIVECSIYQANDGKLLSCLLDHIDSIQARTCSEFLFKMEAVIFSDYRLICNFTENCGSEINQLKCGKADDSRSDPDMPHSQGQVVACLEQNLLENRDSLSTQCQHQIKRLTELSADDYHLDRKLYFECREDRETLCKNVPAGKGLVYKCLFNHKSDHLMSHGCREALTSRQQLIMSQDYKADFGIREACSVDIQNTNCASPQGSSNEDVIGLSSVMLCLENAKFSGTSISKACDDELNDFRKILLEDYEVSPELTNACSKEIRNQCSGNLEKEGETIHCLLGEAQKEGLSPECEKELMNLVKESEVGQDYRMDRVLTNACQEVVESRCNKYEDGDPMVLSCLMDHLHSKQMTNRCKKRLIELQYFVGRDFLMDPTFHKKCQKDVENVCQNAKGADNGDQDNPYTMPFSLVLSCLYRNRPSNSEDDDDYVKNPISPECEDEVNRIMRQRALDVNLNPEIERKCLHDLGSMCSDEVSGENGQELKCLQDHYDDLKPECQDEVMKLTKLEGQNADLDTILINACEPMLQEFCSDVLDNEDEGKVMQCLIDNKELMSNTDCVAGVTHFQLIEMKNYNFSIKFLKACKPDVTKYCKSTEKTKIKTKADVVKCLSLKIRDAALLKQESPISPRCMKEVNVDSLTMHKNIELNPELKMQCQSDYTKFCEHVKPGNARIIECLREHQAQLSKSCHLHLYQFEKEESINRNLDFTLMRTCKSDIKSLCKEQLNQGDPEFIIECLIRNKAHLLENCRKIINEREKEMYSDISLNPDLMDNCQNDIKTHCKGELAEAKKLQEFGGDVHGIIYKCLKEQYRKKTVLSDSCYKHVRFVIKEQEQNYELDPQLTLNCVHSITKYCPPERGNVVECLKIAYSDGKLSKDAKCMVEIARLLSEGRTDIVADPVLYQACANDLATFCDGIPEGRGRLLTCLLRIYDGNSQITYDCKEELIKRKEMWSAASENKVEGFQDVSRLIMNSDNSSYIITLLFFLAMAVLLVGTMCGRLSRRVSVERKMR